MPANTPQTTGAGAGVLSQLIDYAQLAAMTDQELQNLFGIRDMFTQEIDFAALAAATAAVGSFTVQQDANFLWLYATMQADIAAATLTEATNVVPLVSCKLTDQGSGRDLMQANVPVTSLFGTAQRPFVLPIPRFFRAQTQVSMSVLNLTSGGGATTYNLKFSFHGAKFFKFAQAI